jgi:hypothetical protein
MLRYLEEEQVLLQMLFKRNADLIEVTKEKMHLEEELIKLKTPKVGELKNDP